MMWPVAEPPRRGLRREHELERTCAVVRDRSQLLEIARRRDRLAEHDHPLGARAVDPRRAVEIDAHENERAPARYRADRAIHAQHAARGDDFRAVAVDCPELDGMPVEEIGEPLQQPAIVVIARVDTPDEVDGRRRAGRRADAAASPGGGRRKREIDENRERAFRELLRLRARSRKPGVLHQLPVVLDRGVGRPQRHRRGDQLLRRIEIAATQLDDAQHVQGIVGCRSRGDHGAVLARGLVDPARHLRRERALHLAAEQVARTLVEMCPFDAGRAIGRSRGRRRLRRRAAGRTT